MVAIIVEGGKSMWGSDRVSIIEIWLEGGGECAAITGFMMRTMTNKVDLCTSVSTQIVKLT